MSESHTTSPAWQAFEARMRRRRADHCLLRASAALDAEFPEAAEGVLEEARSLCPAHPELEGVAARLSVRSATVSRGDYGLLLRVGLAIGSFLTAVTLLS